MKKKQIEQIPPSRPRFIDEPDYAYVAKAAVVNVSGEDVLLVDVWKLEEKEAVVRIATTKKEFGNYYFETGTWDAKQCDNIFEMDLEEWIADTNTKIQAGWLIKKYGAPGKGIYELSVYQLYLARKKREREYERRMELLAGRCNDMPDLPDVGDWVSDKMGHYIFYKRHGRHVDIMCSKCGHKKICVTKQKDGIDGMLEPLIEVPGRGTAVRCRECGTLGYYEHMNRLQKEWFADRMPFFVIQRFRGDGIVARYLVAEKEYQEDGEKISYEEHVRGFFLPGKKVKKDFYKLNYWSGDEFWDDCNLWGMNNIRIQEADIFPGCWKELKGTFLQYSGLREYMRMRKDKKVNPIQYFESFVKYPFLEMVVKSGMDLMAQRIARGNADFLNTQGKTPADIFRIRKEDVRRLVKKEGQSQFLRLLQLECEMGIRIKPELEKEMVHLLPDERVKLALQYMTAEQFMNRIKKYSRQQNMADRAAALLYMDYLDMRNRRGYDLEDSIIAYPRDLRAAHDRMVLEINAGREKKRISEANKKYPDIRKKYKKWYRKYNYEKGKFMIRPARNAGEIIMEGRILHHCVGGDTYLIRHNEGEGIILFLRECDKKDMPYITIEIAGNEIRQWYGMYDKKTDEEEVTEFLRTYLEHLKEGQEAG